MPILEHNGKVFHHNQPICRYLASQFGIIGSDALENYEIDCVTDTVNELRGSELKYFNDKIKISSRAAQFNF